MFESLRKDGAEVASHADLSDEGQTVHVAVEVGTQAADAADGDQVIEAGKAKVIDTVCQGCGVCTSTCPQGAIQLSHATDNEILAEVNTLCQF